MKNIKLSITMMVKDEEKNLRRCLNSIKKTIDRNDVELVIVDTGSTDKTIEIAKEFTSKVFFQPWNHSFSDMRNKTISYASGEWLFVLDADEEIEDEQHLIDMLDSSILQKYNTIQLILKNFVTNDHDVFSKIASMRFFKNVTDFKYTGSVHNQPQFKNPVFTNTQITLNHYGYNSQDKELMRKKFQRTKTLLEQELEKDPNHVYYRFQLAQSYNMYGDRKNAYLEVKKAYNQLKTTKEKKAYIFVFQLYANICLTLMKYEELVDVAIEGYNLFEEMIDFYYLSAVVKMKMGRSDALKKEIEKYFYLLENLNQLSIIQNASLELYRITDKHKNAIAADYAVYLMNQKEETSLDYIQLITDDSIKKPLLIQFYMRFEIFDKLVLFFSSEQEITNNRLVATIESEIEDLDREKKKQLYSILTSCEGLYGDFNKFRMVDDNEKEEYYPLFEKHFIEILEQPTYQELLIYFVREDIDRFFHLLKKANSDLIIECVQRIIKENNQFKKAIVEFLEDKTCRDNDLNGNRVYYSMASSILFDSHQLKQVEHLLHIFDTYIKAGKAYVRIIFNSNLFKLIYKTLDHAEYKLFMIFSIMDEAFVSADAATVIRLYREAAQSSPHFSKFLEEKVKKIDSSLYEHDLH